MASHPNSEERGGPHLPRCTFLRRRIGCPPPGEVLHLVHLRQIAYASRFGYQVQVSLGPWSPARGASTLFLSSTRSTSVPESDTHHCLCVCYIGLYHLWGDLWHSISTLFRISLIPLPPHYPSEKVIRDQQRPWVAMPVFAGRNSPRLRLFHVFLVSSRILYCCPIRIQSEQYASLDKS